MSLLRRYAWVILALCDGGVLFYGLVILVRPDVLLQLGFESHTGASWLAFRSDEPMSADYLTWVVRMLGAYNVAFGVLALGIILRPFRRGQAWAWWTLALGNLFAFGMPVTSDLYMGSIGFFEVIELAMVPLLLLALGATAKSSLGHR